MTWTKRWTILASGAALLAALCACGTPEAKATSPTQAATPQATVIAANPTATTAPPSVPNATSMATAAASVATARPPMAPTGGLLVGDQAVWPNYIPDDIPPLEGDIYMVMPGIDRIRIQYDSVTADQMDAYLQLLASRGFALDYLVYVQEGFPDRSAERMSRGEWDAVNATWGAYAFRVEYGQGSATLDIETGPFASQVAEALKVSWPPELASVPAPERCELERIDTLAQGGLHISCQREDGNVDRDYEAALVAAGYSEESRVTSPSGTLIAITLSNAEWRVALNTAMSAFLTLDVEPVEPAAQGVLWPVELVGLVPEPPAGVVQSVLPWQGNGYLIQGTLHGWEEWDRYLALLQDAGYGEVDRLVVFDEIKSVELASDRATVVLRPVMAAQSGPFDVSIEVEILAP